MYYLPGENIEKINRMQWLSHLVDFMHYCRIHLSDARLCIVASRSTLELLWGSAGEDRRRWGLHRAIIELTTTTSETNNVLLAVSQPSLDGFNHDRPCRDAIPIISFCFQRLNRRVQSRRFITRPFRDTSTDNGKRGSHSVIFLVVLIRR